MKVMKKLCSILLAGSVILLAVGCSGPDGGGEAVGSNMKVATVTDYGDIDDQSFNQTTYEACKAFTEKNGSEFNYFKPAGDTTEDRVESIETAIADGYDVIVMPGFAFAGAIVETADKHPDVKFVALDISKADLDAASGVEGWSQPNVFSAIYQEEIAGYMAGFAAVKMGYTKLGFLGGMAIPAVIRFGYGYVQGANDAARQLGITVEMNYAYGNQFFGDDDITAVMEDWYDNGTEVIFACGGGIYTSVAEAAAQCGGKVIGVDVDQAPSIDSTYGEGLTVTSACKGLKTTVNTLLQAIADGKWNEYSGQIQNLGLVSKDDLSKNYVGLADSTVWNEGFSQEDYKTLVAHLFDGDIVISADTDAAEPSAEAVTIDFQGNLK